MESVWKAINGLKGSWNHQNERRALKERGDRGTRVGDFRYEKDGLDLGLLRGNMFKITLRYVWSDIENGKCGCEADRIGMSRVIAMMLSTLLWLL